MVNKFLRGGAALSNIKSQTILQTVYAWQNLLTVLLECGPAETVQSRSTKPSFFLSHQPRDRCYRSALTQLSSDVSNARAISWLGWRECSPLPSGLFYHDYFHVLNPLEHRVHFILPVMPIVRLCLKNSGCGRQGDREENVESFPALPSSSSVSHAKSKVPGYP